MRKKTLSIISYCFFAILSAIGYGIFAYIGIYRALAEGSMLHAYLWNVAFIIFFLISDKIVHIRMESRDYVITRRNYLRELWRYIESYVSFKTTIYFFYIFILVASRVTLLEPTLVSADFRSFLLSIEYGLILVVAFDKLTEHLFKDLKRVKAIAEKFKKYESAEKKKLSNKN